MNDDLYKSIGLQALSFIFSTPRTADRFLALTGMDIEAVKNAAKSEDAAFYLGILDFLMNFEPDLQAFCEACQIDGAEVQKSWEYFGGIENSQWVSNGHYT